MADSTHAKPPNVMAPSRPFGLADGMVLVGAAAIGLAFSRGPVKHLLDNPTRGMPAGSFHRAIILIIQWPAALCPIAAALTIATVLLGLKQPRPRLRRLSRQPGFVACAAVVVAMAIGLLYAIPSIMRTANTSRYNAMAISTWISTSNRCGIAVIGAWTALIVSGRRRPEQSWIDRLGRALGTAWIGAVVLEVAVTWVAFFRG